MCVVYLSVYSIVLLVILFIYPALDPCVRPIALCCLFFVCNMYLVLSQEQLEEEGVPADEIEKKVAKKRTDLERKYGSGSHREDGKSNEGGSHVRAKAKEAENARMAQAFGIRADHVEGCLF